MRIGEALGLRHEDIDAASTLIRIRARRNFNGARVKGGQRDVPVPPSLIRLYTDYLVEEYGDLDCDYVFVNLWGGSVGTPWRYWNVTDLVARLRERIVEFSAHAFRHTYATGLFWRGVPAEVVQKLLGHASVTTTPRRISILRSRTFAACLIRLDAWVATRRMGRQATRGTDVSTQLSLAERRRRRSRMDRITHG